MVIGNGMNYEYDVLGVVPAGSITFTQKLPTGGYRDSFYLQLIIADNLVVRNNPSSPSFLILFSVVLFFVFSVNNLQTKSLTLNMFGMCSDGYSYNTYNTLQASEFWLKFYHQWMTLLIRN